MRDDIKFHAFMKMTREAAGVSLEEAGKGLYTKSMMAQIEKGTTLPDYMMRNRIMSRLGISSEGYEDFLQPEEYKRYLKRMELIELIESKQFTEAEKQVDQVLLDEESSLNKLELQFYYDMKARCCKARKVSCEEIFEIYKKDCALTINLEEIKEKKFGVWATQEYFLLFKMLEVKSECGLTTEEKSILAEVCKDLLEHLEKSAMDTLGKAKVYTTGAYALGKIACNDNFAHVDKEYLLKVYDKALEYLKEKGRSYYILEILSDKMELLEEKGLKKELEISKGLYDVIYEVYSQNGIECLMDYNCYIYRDSDIYCIGDVIKSRREMMQISREELAEKVKCSYRTLMRIENGAISAQKAVLRPILDELNINCDYTRSDIITDDRGLLDDYHLLINIINSTADGNYKKLFEELDSKIDFSYQTNVQLWNIIKYLLIMDEGKITEEQYADKMKEDLGLTLPVPVLEIEDGYLLHSEINLLIGIVKYTNSAKEKEHLMQYLENFCNRHESGGYPVDYGAFETITIWMADVYSDEDKLDKVDEIARKLLLFELKSHRFFELHGAMYMLLRNNAKKVNESKKHYEQSLDKLIKICNFINYSVHKDYYVLIKEMLENGDDWKHY